MLDSSLGSLKDESVTLGESGADLDTLYKMIAVDIVDSLYFVLVTCSFNCLISLLLNVGLLFSALQSIKYVWLISTDFYAVLKWSYLYMIESLYGLTWLFISRQFLLPKIWSNLLLTFLSSASFMIDDCLAYVSYMNEDS